MIGVDARSHADTDAQLAAVDRQRAMELLDNLRAHGFDVLDRRHVLAHDREFVTAEARAERLAEQPVQPQPLAHGLQHAIAERVAEAVVDRLEVVEIDRQQREPGIVRLRALDRRFQVHEQLAAIRQIGERIVIREVIQLARALVDFRFELELVRTHSALRVLQLFRHPVERDGQHIELADASSRDARANCAACKPTGRVDQSPHRRGDAGHRDDRDYDQQQHDRRARPHELSIGFVRSADCQPVGIRERAPRRLDQLRHDQCGNLRALVPEQHRAIVEIVDGFESSTASGNDFGQIAENSFEPRLAMNLGKLF